MPKKTKPPEKAANCFDEESRKISDQEINSEASRNWSDDQKNKSYYYDDAYGYEVYDPDEDVEDDENAENR